MIKKKNVKLTGTIFVAITITAYIVTLFVHLPFLHALGWTIIIQGLTFLLLGYPLGLWLEERLVPKEKRKSPWARAGYPSGITSFFILDVIQVHVSVALHGVYIARWLCLLELIASIIFIAIYAVYVIKYKPKKIYTGNIVN